jgi:TPR repeat protein
MHIDKFTTLVISTTGLALLGFSISWKAQAPAVLAATSESPQAWRYYFLDEKLTPYSSDGANVDFRKSCVQTGEGVPDTEFPCDRINGVMQKAGDVGYELVAVRSEQREGYTNDVLYIFKAPKYSFAAPSTLSGLEMYEMGQKYENGKGVARNTQTAIMWYRRAASKQIEQSDRPQPKCPARA